MNNEHIFQGELNFIKDEKVRNFTKEIIEKIPKYFFSIAASSTGKYHPSYALGEGGLVRHTKAAARIAKELLNLEMFNKINPEADYIYSAIILHDGLKCGDPKQEYTQAEHPQLMKDLVLEFGSDKDTAMKVGALIHSHMGQWNKGYGSDNAKEILPKPITSAEKFVHLCDYLASRKQLEFNFKI